MTGLTGLWALVPLIGSIVWLFKVQGALNRFWASVSEPEAEAAPAAPEAPEAPAEPQA